MELSMWGEKRHISLYSCQSMCRQWASSLRVIHTVNTIRAAFRNFIKIQSSVCECVCDFTPSPRMCGAKLCSVMVWLQSWLDAVRFNRQLMIFFSKSLLGAAWYTYNMIPTWWSQAAQLGGTRRESRHIDQDSDELWKWSVTQFEFDQSSYSIKKNNSAAALCY